jgi:hypothetical protein
LLPFSRMQKVLTSMVFGIAAMMLAALLNEESRIRKKFQQADRLELSGWFIGEWEPGSFGDAGDRPFTQTGRQLNQHRELFVPSVQA